MKFKAVAPGSVPQAHLKEAQSARRVKTRIIGLLLVLTIFPAAIGHSQALSDENLTQIRFDQKLNSQVTLSLPFRDENGQEIRLGQCFSGKPVVLVLGYYECPMLCTLVLNGFLESAADLKWSIGREFEVIDVSINPRETPALAAAKKRSYRKRYGRGGAEQGWHFLTASDQAIRQLTSEVGFHYAYDSVAKEYAHPSGLIILTPQGKVSGYLFGVTYGSNDLYTALLRASASQVSSPIQQFVLLCFHYNPITGKYSGMILACVRLLSLGSLVGLFWLIVTLSRRGHTAKAVMPPSAKSPQAPIPLLKSADGTSALRITAIEDGHHAPRS